MSLVEHTATLQKHFHLEGFRPGQSEILTSVLHGRDVLAVLPTGGGKSLCYQFPAVLRRQLVVVISPLIALMKDQVDGLTRLGIPAGAIHSGQSTEDKRDVFRRMREEGPFILYVSPERVQMEGFQQWVQESRVSLFAVDEAHCVSQWGHDFRAEYAQLNVLKKLKSEVPILALTASATPFVLNDVARQLGITKADRHVHGFYRPNLYYQVEVCRDEGEKFMLLDQALKQTPTGRVIIYCGTRSMTEELASSLAVRHEGVDHYHAGLSSEERNRVQNAYAAGELRILVATNAFGMGIDHPDVRLVIHYQIPANIDSLYQEMGRAGRDGRPSTCLLLYAKKDKGLQSYFIQNSRAPGHIQDVRWRGLDNLIAYAEGSECRHAEILTYYQDAKRLTACGHCDVCQPQTPRRVPRPSAITTTQSRASKAKMRRRSAQENQLLTSEQQALFEALRAWRREKARELDVPAFVVLSDRTLRSIAVDQPKDTTQLAGIYGMGEVKIEKFGLELLSEIIAHA